MATILEVEASIDRHYNTNLTQIADLNIKMNILTQLHNNLFTQNNFHQDLKLLKELHANYQAVLTQQAQQMQQSSNIASSVYGSAVNLGGINNTTQGGFASAVNLNGNNQTTQVHDTGDNRLSLNTAPAVVEQPAQVAQQQVTIAPKKLVAAKGYEIKPLLFKEFELELINIGMTQAFEVKLKKGVSMAELSRIPTIEEIEGDLIVINDEVRIFQNMMMHADDKKVQGTTCENNKEHNFIVAKNKPKNVLTEMLAKANFELAGIVAGVNACGEPLKTQLSKFITDIYVPYILIAFRKNQIPIGLDNLVKDYTNLITYCEGRVEKGYPSIVLDVNAAIRLGDKAIKSIHDNTLAVLEALKDDDEYNSSNCIGNLKTLPLYEKVRFLYISSEVTSGLVGNNSFFEMLENVTVPVPLKIDSSGSFQIYNYIHDTSKDINRTLMFDGQHTYSIFKYDAEYYIFKN
jgi:hypothetical protein